MGRLCRAASPFAVAVWSAAGALDRLGASGVVCEALRSIG